MKRASVITAGVALVCVSFSLPFGAFAQTDAPEAQPANPPGGIVHTVVTGDTLWDLSAKYLGTPWKWTEIWERNRFLTNPHYIYPGIKVVVVPPGAREVVLGREAASAPKPAASPESPAAPPVSIAPPPKEPPVPYLDIKPADFVRAGEFTPEAPRGIGTIAGGKDPKVGFSEGDLVFLSLDREIPEGQMLGVYRVRGPIRGDGERPVSGYVKYLIGVVQTVGRWDGHAAARVRQSFEDLTRDDLLSEEIPAYSPVRIDAVGDGLQARVVSGRLENKELAPGDFVYLDRGSSDGVAAGNVFRIFIPAGASAGMSGSSSETVPIEAARAVVVRVNPHFATAYVTDGTESFAAGVSARRGGAAK